MKQIIKCFTFCFLFIANFSGMNAQEKIYLTVNGVTHSATLVDNEATETLMVMLSNGPVNISLTENGGFEKVGNLPQSLPTSDVRQTAVSGDIMLYLGNVLCIFYGSNTWAYTKLGTLDNMSSSEIKEFLSGNPVEVTLSLEDNNASIGYLKLSEIKDEKIYDLKGNLILNAPLSGGIYIINGKKTLIK